VADGTTKRIFSGEAGYALPPASKFGHLFHPRKESAHHFLKQRFGSGGQCSGAGDYSKMFGRDMLNEKAE